MTSRFRPLVKWPQTPSSAIDGLRTSLSQDGLDIELEAIVSGSHTFSWAFGDGASAIGASASHTYAAAGTYTVELSIDGVVEQTFSVTVADNPGVTVTRTVSVEIDGLEIVVNASVDDGQPHVYGWTFGDGASSSSASDTHTYAAPDGYVIELVIDGAVVYSNGFLITVPPVQGAITSASSGLDVDFDAVVLGAQGGEVYAWDFGDGTNSAAQNPPLKTYAADGTYTVTLSINGAQVDSIDVTVAAPVGGGLSAGISAEVSGVDVDFSAVVLGAQGGEVYAWDFGDGTNSAAQNPGVKSYATGGAYVVTLSVDGVLQDTLNLSLSPPVGVGDPIPENTVLLVSPRGLDIAIEESELVIDAPLLVRDLGGSDITLTTGLLDVEEPTTII